LSTKCNEHADSEPKDKKRRKVLSPFEKLEVLENVDKEIRITAVNHHHGVNKSENCFTKINKDENRGSIRSQCSSEKKSFLC
jgi:hypothetical protein